MTIQFDDITEDFEDDACALEGVYELVNALRLSPKLSGDVKELVSIAHNGGFWEGVDAATGVRAAARGAAARREVRP